MRKIFFGTLVFSLTFFACSFAERDGGGSQLRLSISLPRAVVGGGAPATRYVLSVNVKGKNFESNLLFNSEEKNIPFPGVPIGEEVRISIAAFPEDQSETPILYFGAFPVGKTERYKVEPTGNSVRIELLPSQTAMAEGGMIYFKYTGGGNWDEMHVFETTGASISITTTTATQQKLTFKDNSGTARAPNPAITGRVLVVGGGGGGGNAGNAGGLILAAGGGGGGGAVITRDSYVFRYADYCIVVGSAGIKSMFGHNNGTVSAPNYEWELKAVSGGKGGEIDNNNPPTPSKANGQASLEFPVWLNATSTASGGSGGGAAYFLTGNSGIIACAGGPGANGAGHGYAGGRAAGLAIAAGGGGGQDSIGISGDAAPLPAQNLTIPGFAPPAQPNGTVYGGYGGHGGWGKSSTITGTLVYYGAGGGGGAITQAGHGGKKGSDGEQGLGGVSNLYSLACSSNDGINGASGNMSNLEGSAGGGGGGGASIPGSGGGAGGKGGAGLVIVRFPYKMP